MADTPAFIHAMLRPDFYDHPVQICELIETHISWVILTGDFVYKIKKPVDFGFLDFSTLEKRKFYSEEELRLNRRLAPDLYLAVIPLTGSIEQPELNGKGEAFEYTVKMQQFPQEAQLDHVLSRNELTPQIIDSIAHLISNFHQHIEVADDSTDYGEVKTVHQPFQENFEQIKDRVQEKSIIDSLNTIEQWSNKTFNKLKNLLAQRKAKGFIRECHGDLHLRNLAWQNNAPIAFDCLEFNPNFRWIDVISEIAFLIMDLDDHNQPELAQRFLNTYLELTGDYNGCQVLRFYQVYRAMVRAKVDAIRTLQSGISKNEADAAHKEFKSYLQLAQSYTYPSKPFIIITRGMSAAGKSKWSQRLLEHIGAIRIRSDVERKRLYNILPNDNPHENIAQGIYSADATKQTYLKLLELAETIIDSGFPVIVDATFPNIELRNAFKSLAEKKHVRFIIMEFVASDETLKQRILKRTNNVSDADIHVLENQLKNWPPLSENEKSYSIKINTDNELTISDLIKQLETKLI